MHPGISLALSLFFGLVFVFQVARHELPSAAEHPTEQEDKLKKIYWHANPGTTDDPHETANPFVQIILPIEAKDHSVRYRTYSVDSRGQVMSGEHWRAEDDFPNCVEHEFVKRGTPPAK